jgi:predicted nucleotidyltransferase
MENAFNIAKELGTSISQKVEGIDDVILFGSVARSEFTSYSDIDLLVVFNNYPPTPIYNLYANLSKKVDVIKIESLIKYGSIKYGAIKYGKLNSANTVHILYCQNDALQNNHPIINNIDKDGISLI